MKNKKPKHKIPKIKKIPEDVIKKRRYNIHARIKFDKTIKKPIRKFHDKLEGSQPKKRCNLCKRKVNNHHYLCNTCWLEKKAKRILKANESSKKSLKSKDNNLDSPQSNTYKETSIVFGRVVPSEKLGEKQYVAKSPEDI